MPKSGFLRFLLILTVSAVVWFVAGFFTDLPPYGIKVKSTDTTIRFDGKNRVYVNSQITFQCISSFPRKNEYFFPIYTSEKQGRGQDIKGYEVTGEAKTSEGVFRDTGSGVLYRLRLKPGETRKIVFSFYQDVSGDSFVCNFTGMTGWGSKAGSVNYKLELPQKLILHSIPPHNFDKETPNSRIFYLRRKNVADPGILMKWDRGEL